ncbi:MAG: hypothetical protein ABIK65_16480 [Candidatus Eisenbacteria bacterium]
MNRLLSFVLLLCAACAPASPPRGPAPSPESEYPVLSYRLSGTDRYNAGIDAAIAEEKHWPRSPLRTVSQYFGGPEEAPRITFRKTSGPGEFPDRCTVTVTEEGLLDDSVAGTWHEFHLVRTAEGYWRVREIRTADRCARGDYQRDAYGEKPCP